MLYLNRKDGEQIVIDEKIVIEVVRIAGNRVTLGIAAPSYVKILRAELEPKELEPKELAPKELAPKELAPKELAPKELAPKEAVSTSKFAELNRAS